jgi:ribonuclease HII
LENNTLIVGLDEVGRGCLAGPVIAAAVILDKNKKIEGLADSKKLTNAKRKALDKCIRRDAIAFSIGRAEVLEIDEINILHASLLAMKRAYDGLHIKADYARVDGIYYPIIEVSGECIKGGDNLFEEISAASIIAKVYRDDHMETLDAFYSGYGFAKHKGYPTAEHNQLLKNLGISNVHRRSFAPVKRMIDG